MRTLVAPGGGTPEAIYNIGFYKNKYTRIRSGYGRVEN
jgi:hypothetical protein